MSSDAQRSRMNFIGSLLQIAKRYFIRNRWKLVFFHGRAKRRQQKSTPMSRHRYTRKTTAYNHRLPQPPSHPLTPVTSRCNTGKELKSNFRRIPHSYINQKNVIRIFTHEGRKFLRELHRVPDDPLRPLTQTRHSLPFEETIQKRNRTEGHKNSG